MKTYFLALTLLVAFNSMADIEYSASQSSKVTPQEVSQNRACFEEVAKQGCGDPGEDPKHFRACLKNVMDSLTPSCNQMMTELYGSN